MAKVPLLLLPTASCFQGVEVPTPTLPLPSTTNSEVAVPLPCTTRPYPPAAFQRFSMRSRVVALLLLSSPIWRYARPALLLKLMALSGVELATPRRPVVPVNEN